MYYGNEPVPSNMPEAVPNRGPSTDPNPGERSAQDDAQGTPVNSLGPIPARGNKAGGGQEIDTGAKVGIMRNLEFTAGGRAHRLSTGTFSSARPTVDPKSGNMHTSTASDAGDPSTGHAAGNQSHALMPSSTEGVGDKNDTSEGNIDPSRRRDTKTV